MQMDIELYWIGDRSFARIGDKSYTVKDFRISKSAKGAEIQVTVEDESADKTIQLNSPTGFCDIAVKQPGKSVRMQVIW